MENARLMIFETFCRIHQCISIGMLAEKLNMNPDEAERWIVNLIRNARLDAKIDSKLGHVVMGAQPLSPYQQLIEKIDSLSVRSETLCGLIDRKLKAKTDVSGLLMIATKISLLFFFFVLDSLGKSRILIHKIF